MTDSLRPISFGAYVGKPPTILVRFIHWIRKNDSAAVDVLKICCLAVVVFFAAFFLIGIPLIARGWKIVKKIDREQAFKVFAKHLASPSRNLSIEIKTARETFNHTHEFVIRGGVIWNRRKVPEKKRWQPLYFDGFPKRVPVELQADGCNLVAIDQKREVHYKKVIREANMGSFQKTYRTFDKVFKNNWKPAWFSLPYLAPLLNLFQTPRLRLQKGIRGWTVSHRGQYNHFYEDALGKRHKVQGGCTTLFVLSSDGKTIFKYDPWCPKHAKMRVTLPLKKEENFEGINLSASASTLLLLGYKLSKASDGTTEKKLSLKTRLTDMDVEVWNPLINKHLDYTSDDPKKIAPFFNEWEEHPLPQEGTVTKVVTILQTGRGNSARELRIEGWDSEGKAGYWKKRLTESLWEFITYAEPKKMGVPLARKGKAPALFRSEVSDYYACRLRFPAKVIKPLSCTLEGFSEKTPHSLLRFDYEGRGVACILRQTKSLRHFMGIGSHSYHMIYPHKPSSEDLLSTLFPKGREWMSVSVRAKKDRISISKGSFGLELRKKV